MTKNKKSDRPGCSEAETKADIPLVRNQFNRGPRVQIKFAAIGRTKQSFKDECDVNLIMSNYLKTGQIRQNGRSPEYGYASSLDFRESMELITDAQAEFANLPSALRKRFGNDPMNFLEFCEDPDNASEAQALGLTLPPPEDPATDVSDVRTESPEPPAGPTNDENHVD